MIYSDYFFFEIVRNVPRPMGVISVFITAFTLYVILFKSTNHMHTYKYVLSAITIAGLLFDVMFSVFFSPIPLGKAYGLAEIGLLAEAFPTHGNLISLVALDTYFIVGRSFVIGFIYREYSVSNRTNSKRPILFNILQAIVFLLFDVEFACVFYLPCVSDEDGRKYLEQVNASVPEEYAVWVIPKYTAHRGIPWFLTVFAVVIFLAVSIFYSVFRINRVLKKSRVFASSSSIAIQKMLLRALLIQLLAFVMLLLVPCVLGILIFLLSRIIGPIEDYLHFDFGTEFTALTLTLPCLFSPIHTFCTLYFTTPYRKYCKSLILRNENGITVINSSGTSTSSTNTR